MTVSVQRSMSPVSCTRHDFLFRLLPIVPDEHFHVMFPFPEIPSGNRNRWCALSNGELNGKTLASVCRLSESISTWCLFVWASLMSRYLYRALYRSHVNTWCLSVWASLMLHHQYRALYHSHVNTWCLSL